jgi:hypothetical protein
MKRPRRKEAEPKKNNLHSDIVGGLSGNQLRREARRGVLTTGPMV